MKNGIMLYNVAGSIQAYRVAITVGRIINEFIWCGNNLEASNEMSELVNNMTNVM